MNYLTEEAIQEFIRQALQEDVGDGDHSSLASISNEARSQAKLLIKDSGILAGMELAGKIFKAVDPELFCESYLKDGAKVKMGDVALVVKGRAQSILKAERLVLNCMQRMSGIATMTQQYSSLIKGTKAKLLDTRKTTPNFRLMEKWAVAIGGGNNHRFGLYDMIILKDNHVDYAGGIRKAIESSVEYLKRTNRNLKIEIETRTLREVKEVLETGGVDRIMLDNMSVGQMRDAIQLINGKYETEASGGVTSETIGEIAKTGVDFISVGALTHSYKSLDMSLKAF